MKVVIIGAGPAGLFAAKKLRENDIDVTIIEQQHKIGGAGLQADGKLNFTYKDVGGTDLTEFVSEEKAKEIIYELSCFFWNRNIHSSLPTPQTMNYIQNLATYAGYKYIPVDIAHIGTDELKYVMNEFYKYLRELGTTFLLGSKVIDIKNNVIITTDMPVPYDVLLIAVGRTGALNFKPIFDKLGIEYTFNPVDIGIRVEIPLENIKHLTDECKEIKLITYTRRNEKVRTFCMCEGGYINVELYGKFNDLNLIGVNGHSNSKIKSPNTNFALLNTVHLTKPFTDTTLLGQSIAYTTNILGGGKPIVQCYSDFLSRQRTNEERIEKCILKPTLSNTTLGDITFAYPAKIIDNLEEALFRLGRIIPLNPDSTLLYAPEIKFYARRIKTDKYLETTVPNIFVAGDGAGISRGIIGAGATGIIAANGIIEKFK